MYVLFYVPCNRGVISGDIRNISDNSVSIGHVISVFFSRY